MEIKTHADLKPIAQTDSSIFEAYFHHSVNQWPWQQPWHINFPFFYCQPNLVLWKIIDHCLCVFGRTEDLFFLYMPPLGAGNLEPITRECFNIIKQEGFEPMIMCDFPGYNKREGVLLERTAYTKNFIIRISDVAEMVWPALGDTIKGFVKIQPQFRYSKYNPAMHSLQAETLIQKQCPDISEFNNNILSNLSELNPATIFANVAVIDGKVEAIAVGAQLNDHTLALVVNAHNAKIDGLGEYNLWAFHLEARRRNYKFMNVGFSMFYKDIVSHREHWRKFKSMATLELNSWRKATHEEMLDMSGTP